jgi:hypothetical protein
MRRLGTPPDAESAGDEAPRGERLAGGRHDSGLEAGITAGLDDEAFRGGHDPVVVGELRQRDGPIASGERMRGRKPDQEGVLEELDPLRVVELATFSGRVLSRTMDLAQSASHPFAGALGPTGPATVGVASRLRQRKTDT